MGKAERTKGHNWERELAKIMRELFPEARRGQQCRDGADAPDVEGTPFHLEAKVGKLPNPRAALYQAIRDSKGRRPAVAVVKDDRCTPFVCMTLTDWLALVRAAYADPEVPQTPGVADMPMVKPDSSIRSGKAGRTRMHPAGDVERKNQSSGLLDSKRTPSSRVTSTKSSGKVGSK